MKAIKAKLYVGCALTESPKDFQRGVELLKKHLRAEGHEVFDFVGLVDGTPADVYNWDIGHCVKDCDALIAICDYPGIGLGYEVSEAVHLKKPVLALGQTDSRVTRLILGAPDVVPNVRFERYGNLKAVPALVNKWLNEVLSKRKESS